MKVSELIEKLQEMEELDAGRDVCIWVPTSGEWLQVVNVWLTTADGVEIEAGRVVR